MEKHLNNKIAVVTGASRGIGRSIALKLAAHGAYVVLLARGEDHLNKVKSEIESNGGKAAVFTVDLRQPQQIQSAFAQIAREIGKPSILINNAGMGSLGKSIVHCSVEDYEETFNLNVRGLIAATQQVLPGMMQAQEGLIINIGSIWGRQGVSNASLYCASKFAVVGFTEALLEEATPYNIRVSLISPGRVYTESQFRFKSGHSSGEQFIDPEDVAEAVLTCTQETATATIKEIVIRPRRMV